MIAAPLTFSATIDESLLSVGCGRRQEFSFCANGWFWPAPWGYNIDVAGNILLVAPPASSTPVQSRIDLTPALVTCGQSVLIGVVTGECGFATARRLEHCMGIVVQFRRPVASSE